MSPIAVVDAVSLSSLFGLVVRLPSPSPSPSSFHYVVNGANYCRTRIIAEESSKSARRSFSIWFADDWLQVRQGTLSLSCQRSTHRILVPVACFFARSLARSPVSLQSRPASPCLHCASWGLSADGRCLILIATPAGLPQLRGIDRRAKPPTMTVNV